MELWEVKANALRLMFADSDLNFSKDEFENGVLYENGNTRDKLVRMNDSIRRGIDLYYQFTSQYNQKTLVKYFVNEDGDREPYLDLSNVMDFSEPSRIDVLKGDKYHVLRENNLEYFFDNLTKKIYVSFNRKHSEDLLKSLEFVLYYKMKNSNLPNDIEIDDLTFNLNDLNIPEGIQRALPLYVKSEIYEEDEYAVAKASRNEFMEFLITYAKKFSSVRTKVVSKFVRG